LKDDLCQISSLNDEPADLNTPSGEGNKSSVKNNKIGEMRGKHFCVGYLAEPRNSAAEQLNSKNQSLKRTVSAIVK